MVSSFKIRMFDTYNGCMDCTILSKTFISSFMDGVFLGEKVDLSRNSNDHDNNIVTKNYQTCYLLYLQHKANNFKSWLMILHVVFLYFK